MSAFSLYISKIIGNKMSFRKKQGEICFAYKNLPTAGNAKNLTDITYSILLVLENIFIIIIQRNNLYSTEKVMPN